MAEQYEASSGTQVNPAQSAAGRYQALESDRRPFLNRARRYATLTIPGLMPPEGTNGATELPEPFQSTGAEGVNNLGAKLLLILFPTGASFFRSRLNAKLEQEAGDNLSEYDDALAKRDQQVTNRMEAKGNRSVRFEALQHLLVTGNGLIHVLPEGKEKFFPLDHFVVCRDLEDNELEIIVKETLARESLPANIRVMLLDDGPATQETADVKKTVDVYTWVKRASVDSLITVHQEVQNKIVPESEGSYPAGKSAWLPLRWRKVPGQAYGRSRCEEYGGDLSTLEGFTKAILKFAIACAKILFLTKPGGHAQPEDLQKAESGDFLPGSEGDVKAVQIDKFPDFQIVKQVADEAKQRLEKAFLLAASVQRDAERVTAEEIRAMIGQLEESLGGQYAMLSEDFQRPLVACHIHQMQKAREIDPLPDKAVDVEIITGLEGLGRNNDLNKLDQFIAGGEQVFGPEVTQEYINPGEYYRRRGTALGVETKGLVRSDDEVQQNQQAKQQAEMTNRVAPDLVRAGANAAQNTASAQPQPTEESNG